MLKAEIVVAPSAWRGSFAAGAVADHIADAIRGVRPRATVTSVPLADGGDGTLDVLAPRLGLDILACTVRSPSGRPVVARAGWHAPTRTGVVEMAEASGLHLDAEPEALLHRSSYGAGELIAGLLDRGCDRLVFGAGGSATADAGAGLARALGAERRDGHDRPLDGTPASLRTLAAVDRARLHPRLHRAKATMLSDTAVPLAASVRTFGPQKGVAPGEQRPLEEAVFRATGLLQGTGARDRAWHAAGGGAAGTVATLFGTVPVSGARWVARLAGLPALVRPGTVVVTAEGRFDASSLRGKATGEVVRLCRAARAACVVVCASADPNAVARVPGRVVPLAPGGGRVALADVGAAAAEALP